MRNLLKTVLLILCMVYTSISMAKDLYLPPAEARYFGVTAQLDIDYGTGGLLSSIVLRESSFCTNKHSSIDKHGWGCGQLHTKTAKDIAHVNVTSQQLMKDDRLNLELTAYVIKDCISRFPENIYRAVYCYKNGYRATYFVKYPEKQAYPRQVMQLRSELIQWLARPLPAPALPKESETSQLQPVPIEMLECIAGIDGTKEDHLCQDYILGRIELYDGLHPVLAEPMVILNQEWNFALRNRPQR